MDEVIKSTIELVKLTSENDTSKILSIIGILFIIMGLVAVFYLVNKKPEEIARSQKWATFWALTWGIVFSIAGPAVTLLQKMDYYQRGWKNATSLQDRIDDLRLNKLVGRVMRIVLYDPVKEMDLKIDRLGYLGPKDQRYTFVADYDELKGLTFAEAARYIGLLPQPSMKMSAVIFPTPKVLIPANARGLLKIVNGIETSN